MRYVPNAIPSWYRSGPASLPHIPGQYQRLGALLRYVDRLIRQSAMLVDGFFLTELQETAEFHLPSFDRLALEILNLCVHLEINVFYG